MMLQFFFFPWQKKNICKWSRLIHKSLHSTLGLCYKERFDSLPSLSWALTTLLFPSPLCLFKSTATPSSPAPPHTSFISSTSTSHWRRCPSDCSPLHWSCYAAYSGIQRGTPELHSTISISTKRKCVKSFLLLHIQRINLKWKYEETKRWKKWCSHPLSLSHGSVPALPNAEHVPNSRAWFYIWAFRGKTGCHGGAVFALSSHSKKVTGPTPGPWALPCGVCMPSHCFFTLPSTVQSTWAQIGILDWQCEWLLVFLCVPAINDPC